MTLILGKNGSTPRDLQQFVFFFEAASNILLKILQQDAYLTIDNTFFGYGILLFIKRKKLYKKDKARKRNTST